MASKWISAEILISFSHPRPGQNAGYSLTILGNYTRLDTYFGQHSYGYTNFVTRDAFLGNSIGNDADLISAGLRLGLSYPLIAEISLGRKRWGENSLIEDPYAAFPDFEKQSFPSGDVEEYSFIEFKFDYHPLDYLDISLRAHYDLTNSGAEHTYNKWLFKAGYYLPYWTFQID